MTDQQTPATDPLDVESGMTPEALAKYRRVTQTPATGPSDEERMAEMLVDRALAESQTPATEAGRRLLRDYYADNDARAGVGYSLGKRLREVEEEAACRLRLPVKLLRSVWPPNEGVMHGNERFDAMVASIERDGIQEPVTINLDWIVIDGNHRVAAARLLGIEVIAVRVWTGVEYVA